MLAEWGRLYTVYAARCYLLDLFSWKAYWKTPTGKCDRCASTLQIKPHYLFWEKCAIIALRLTLFDWLSQSEKWMNKDGDATSLFTKIDRKWCYSRRVMLMWHAQFFSGSIKTYLTRNVQISNRKMSLWNCLIQRINLIITKIIHYPLLRNNLSCRPRRTYCCSENDETAAGRWSGAPNVNFRIISVRKKIWDLEFSEHLL